jgi:hypothetical protein
MDKLDLLNDLRDSQNEILKELKSLNRKGRASEYIGTAIVVITAFSLMINTVTLGAGLGLMGIGLLISIIAARYLLTAATLPATRLAIEYAHREIERISDLDLDHPLRAGR